MNDPTTPTEHVCPWCSKSHPDTECPRGPGQSSGGYTKKKAERDPVLVDGKPEVDKLLLNLAGVGVETDLLRQETDRLFDHFHLANPPATEAEREMYLQAVAGALRTPRGEGGAG